MPTITDIRNAWRIGPISAVDFLGTIAIGYWISRRWETPVLKTIAGTLAVGELTHLALGISTPVVEDLLPVNKVEI
jgi:hypothetical protein